MDKTDAGRVNARSTAGALLWRVDGFGGGPLRIEPDERGHIVVNGETVLDRLGRVVERIHHGTASQTESKAEPINFAVVTATTPAWDAPVEIGLGSPFKYILNTAPLIDGKGDAWIVMYASDGFNDSIQAFAGS